MDELNIETFFEEGVLKMKLIGRVNAVNAEKIMESAKQYFDGLRTIIIDVAQIEYLSSSGVRQLVQLNTVARSKGGRLFVRNANDIVKEILDGIGLLDFVS
ncbi:MAG: STAS domain-containing protein [Lachnospiraceae bacterium]|nr:STAS domain-containing protein [Lachnospiraceae bacterium]